MMMQVGNEQKSKSAVQQYIYLVPKNHQILRLQQSELPCRGALDETAWRWSYGHTIHLVMYSEYFVFGTQASLPGLQQRWRPALNYLVTSEVAQGSSSDCGHPFVGGPTPLSLYKVSRGRGF